MEPKLIRIDQVQHRTTLGKTLIYEPVAAGRLPQPIRVGVRRVAWLAVEIDSWIADRAAERDGRVSGDEVGLSMPDSTPNTPAALDFLEQWEPGGPWVLTAIRPDRKSIETRTFTERQPCGEWVDGHNGSMNLYFHVNPCTRHLEKKADREQVAALAWLHVDIDPREGENIDEERARALGLLTDKLPEGVPPPTVIIFSGGGYQGFWKLSDPFLIDGDLERAEEAKLWNLQLELFFGADNCHNVDRIMRLPGTVNLPDRKKLKKGRVPTTATLEKFSDEVYSLDQFTAAPMVQETAGPEGLAPQQEVQISGNVPRLADISQLDQWGVHDYTKVVCVQGRHPEPNEGQVGFSRSEWLFYVSCELVRRDVPDEVIYSVITDPDFGISESVLEQSRPHDYAVRQIARAKEQAVAPHLAELNERFFVVEDEGGRCLVAFFRTHRFESGQRRRVLVTQSFSDFKRRFMNRTGNQHVMRTPDPKSGASTLPPTRPAERELSGEAAERTPETRGARSPREPPGAAPRASCNPQRGTRPHPGFLICSSGSVVRFLVRFSGGSLMRLGAHFSRRSWGGS